MTLPIAQAVIGSNFGDEGKGLVTDYLTSRDHAINVRFNGGAQAGHTVVPDGGKRFVFGHFGAGTFNLSPTFLSQHFIVNPLLFDKEYKVLTSHPTFHILPDLHDEHAPYLALFSLKKHKVFVHANAPVTTPFDMMMNQIFEIARATTMGKGRHGSCGIGINETVKRTLNPEYALRVRDLLDVQHCTTRMFNIRDEWVKKRLEEEGLDIKEAMKGLLDDAHIDNFVNAYCADMLDSITIVDNYDELLKYDRIVFEGAQGLLLDEYHKWFPHVTRSRTGIINAATIAQSIGIEQIEAFYVTRAYLTRHGAGPLPFERPSKIYDAIVDETNITNPFQGPLRFAPCNLDLLREHISADVVTGNKILKVSPSLVVTCMDQVPDKVQYVDQGIEKEDTMFLQEVVRVHNFDSFLISNGPSRQTIWEL